jgi:PAS domain S-box-containing protein
MFVESDRPVPAAGLADMPNEPSTYALLVVDDDIVDRENVRRTLSRAGVGASIDEAADALTALAKIPHGDYDCIILDYNMPRGDGLTLLRGIRAAGLDVAVVMLTGQRNDQLAADLLKAGATDYVAKDDLTPERLAGSVHHAVSFARVQREARRAETELRATAERLRLATESAGVGTWDLDLTTGQLTGAERLATIYGFTPDERPSYEDCLSRIHPDDREGAARARTLALDPSGDGYYRAEYRVVWPAGAIRWVDTRGRAFFSKRDGQHRAVRMVGSALDVTERKRAEEALREEAQLVETLHRIGGSVAAELDFARVAQTVTDDATTLTGARLGVFFYTMSDNGESPRPHLAISGVLRAGDHVPEPPDESVLLRDNASVVRSDDIRTDSRRDLLSSILGILENQPDAVPMASCLSVPVLSHGGAVHGRLLLGHPLPGEFTDRHERLVAGIAAWATVAMDNARLYMAAQRARAESERAYRAKSAFLAMMSHELRTPLNAIGGYAQLIVDDIPAAPSAQHKEYARRVLRGKQHLLGLIDTVLTHAKIEAGKIAYRIEDFRVLELLAAVEPLITPQLEAKAIHYSSASCDRALRVRADRDKAVQILLNLLSNALKFTGRAGSISVATELDGDGRVRLSVRDTGCGIPRDKLPVIFEPFVQVESAQTFEHKGTGLGLTISREFARGMGGDLQAESEPGVGSAFILTLPSAG